MKILAPAGNFESLKTAIFNGADEVYLGINQFNARNNIDGFTLDSLNEAVDFTHLFDVKVNLAINILFSDDELDTAVKTLLKAYEMGVDAFIVQDLGLIQIISKNYPEIILHASTQMGIHNLEGVRFLEKFGIKRVVLARETTIKEIKRIKENSNIEIEYFAHGALCVSFSGNCYLSSLVFNASGNRGKCKQPCRLPYTLKQNEKTIKKGYLLSAKDFCTIDRLDELKNAGVSVLKIEGRARRPYYVGAITRAYANAIKGEKIDRDSILLAFNRNFTFGYFDGNGNIISSIQNHIGIEIGKVKSVNVGKNFNEVYITSSRQIFKKSSLKFFDGGIEKATISAYDVKVEGENLYKITTTTLIKKGWEVRLIVDYNEEQKILEFSKKRNLSLSLSLRVNMPISATITIENEKIEVLGDVLDLAKSSPITEREILDNFYKNEYFLPKIKFDRLDNVFMPKKALNEFRRKVYLTAFDYITKKYKRKVDSVLLDYKKKVVSFDNFEIIYSDTENSICKNVIYSPSTYDIDKILALKNRLEKENKNLYLDLPNYAESSDIILLENIVKRTEVGVIANNYYALTKFPSAIIGGGLNVYNSYTANILQAPVITVESSIAKTIDFPYMTLRHCPIKAHIGGDCSNCKYSDNLTYTMDDGRVLKLKRKKLSTCTFYLTK